MARAIFSADRLPRERRAWAEVYPKKSEGDIVLPSDTFEWKENLRENRQWKHTTGDSTADLCEVLKIVWRANLPYTLK